MKKDILIVFAIVIIITVLISGTDFQSVDEYYLVHADDITEDSETVFIKIDASNILGRPGKIPPELKEYIPEDGIILDSTETVLRPGDTVFDLTYRIVRCKQIQFDFAGPESNSFGTAYVKGISYLYEFALGPRSGWIYLVNGVSPDVGASGYKPKDGDTVTWVYTLSLGDDIAESGAAS